MFFKNVLIYDAVEIGRGRVRQTYAIYALDAPTPIRWHNRDWGDGDMLAVGLEWGDGYQLVVTDCGMRLHIGDIDGPGIEHLRRDLPPPRGLFQLSLFETAGITVE